MKKHTDYLAANGVRVVDPYALLYGTVRYDKYHMVASQDNFRAATDWWRALVSTRLLGDHLGWALARASCEIQGACNFVALCCSFRSLAFFWCLLGFLIRQPKFSIYSYPTKCSQVIRGVCGYPPVAVLGTLSHGLV